MIKINHLLLLILMCCHDIRPYQINNPLSLTKALPNFKMPLTDADEIECCADSGTTQHMLPDYLTFISYHHCHNTFVTLRDCIYQF